MKVFLLVLGLALIFTFAAQARAEEEERIDLDRAWQLRVKQLEGEALTPEEEAYLERAEAFKHRIWSIQRKRRENQALTPEEEALFRWFREAWRRRGEAYRKANPPRDSWGLTPLIDLEGTYRGEEGGLYPGGGNAPTEGHLKAGLKRAEGIVPLDAEGAPSEAGKIVLLSIGMSNALQEFQVFQKLAGEDPEVNPAVLTVNGARGSQTAELTANPDGEFWQWVDDRLDEAGATREQVQVVWIKQTLTGPSRPFPKEVKRLQGHLETNLNILADRFANLKTAYLSSRIYGGYAEGPLNPEPHSYETAFAVKRLIADQVSGKPELNYDPEKGAVRSPWLAWGPYLWADGLKARSDGLTYVREDLADDGTHPSMSGREKVGRQLLAFLKGDPTARPWFVRATEP